MKYGLNVFRVLFVAVLIQVLAAGCKGGGLSSLLGGEHGDGSSEVFAAFGPDVSDGSGGGSGSGSGGGSGGGGGSGNSGPVPGVATVHHPEPGSLALFGGGLASLALWRRRKAGRVGLRRTLSQ